MWFLAVSAAVFVAAVLAAAFIYRGERREGHARDD
jgi:hypothetical protein